MTDLGPGLGFDQPMAIDASALDRKLQTISHAEATWNMPALPDAVKLDLLSSPDMTMDMGEFLQGLSSDMTRIVPEPINQFAIGTPQLRAAQAVPELENDEPAPEGFESLTQSRFNAVQRAWTNPARNQPVESGMNKFRGGIQDVTNPGAWRQRPEALSTQAVNNLISEGIAADLLPEDTPQNGKWTPELNSVRFQLMQRRVAAEMRGDRGGAISVGKVADLLDKWTSPTGLMAAAIALDFVPDVKEIRNEFDTWGEKISSWKDDPLDARKFLDAWGPIDDIALPVLNVAMLASGVGSVGLFALKGTQLVKAGSVLYKAGQFAQLGVRAEQLGQAGLLAGNLAKGGKAVGTLGRGMQRWREWTYTQVGKRATQEAMKMGLASNLESTIFNSGRDDDEYTKWMERRTNNPIGMALSTSAELLLAPQGIFLPGRIKGLYTGAAGSRPVDAVRKMVEVGQDEKLQLAVLPGALSVLGATDPARAAQIAKVSQKEPTRAIAMVFAGADEKSALNDDMLAEAGAAMKDLAFNVGLDKMATMLTPGALTPEEARQGYHMIRNKLGNEIRPTVPVPDDLLDASAAFDPSIDAHRHWANEVISRLHGTEDPPWTLEAQAAADLGLDPDKVSYSPHAMGPARQRAQDRTYQALWSEDPAVVQAEVDRLIAMTVNHDVHRVSKFNQILDGVSEQDISNYVTRFPEAIQNLGQREEYIGAMDRIQEWAVDSGHLTLSRRGVGEIVKENRWVPNALNEDIKGAEMPASWLSTRGRHMSFFDDELDMAATRVAVARVDTITKQQAVATGQYVKYLRGRLKTLQGLSADESETFEAWGRQLTASEGWGKRQFSDRRLNKVYDQIKATSLTEGVGASVPDVLPINKRQFREYGRILQWVQQNSGDPQEASKFIQGRLDKVFENDQLFKDLGISRLEVTDLDKFQKAIDGAIPFLAAELDNVDDATRALLAERGYMPVLMFERVAPRDILDLSRNPLPEVAAWKRDVRALGTLGTKVDHGDVAKLRDRQMRTLLPAKVKQISGREIGEEDYDYIVGLLREDMNKRWDLQAELDQMPGRRFAKVLDGMKGNAIPRGINDMALAEIRHALRGVITDDRELKAIHGALQQSRQIGFENRGLAHLEDVMTSNSPIRMLVENVAGTTVAADFKRAGQRLGLSKGPAVESYDGLKTLKNAKKVAVAGVAGYLGANTAMNQEADGEWVAAIGAGSALAGGIIGPKLGSPRNVASVVAGLTAGQAVASATGDGEAGVAAGIAAGLGVAVGAPRAAQATLGVLDKKGWAQYSWLGDRYRVMRDVARFSLSPIFDLQRYTEGMMLGYMREGDTLDVKGLYKPLKYASETLGLGDQAALRSQYRSALGNFYNSSLADVAEILEESTGSYFVERGMFGFSSLDWEAGIYHQLVNTGKVDPREAVERARQIFTYGTKGRSAVEQSINFVFFPFSFQKKFVTEIGEFMADDLSRVVALHNSMKAYEVLDEKYDLGKVFEERLPILTLMRNFNPVAYGFSPGRFGGVNAPLIELAMDTPATASALHPIANAFLPQSLQIAPAAPDGTSTLGKFGITAEQLTKFADQSLAVARNARQLWGDTMAQGHVLADPAHVTAQAQIGRGWTEYRKMREETRANWEAAGIDWDSVMRAQPGDPSFVLQAQYKMQERRLRQGNESWHQNYLDVVANRAARERERVFIVDSPTDSAEQSLALFDAEVNEIGSLLSATAGVGGDKDQWDPMWHQKIRERAIQLARQNAGFLILYNSYYLDDFGPITEEV